MKIMEVADWITDIFGKRRLQKAFSRNEIAAAELDAALREVLAK